VRNIYIQNHAFKVTANKIDAIILHSKVDAILKPKRFKDEGWSEPFAHNEHHADTIEHAHLTKAQFLKRQTDA
jgi:hypothetical protein